MGGRLVAPEMERSADQHDDGFHDERDSDGDARALLPAIELGFILVVQRRAPSAAGTEAPRDDLPGVRVWRSVAVRRRRRRRRPLRR